MFLVNYNLNKKMGRKASFENGQLMTTGLQKSCFWMAILDVLFYFATIISCIVVETVVSNKRPMRFEIRETGVEIVEPVQLPYGKDDIMAIWDYLHTEHYGSAWTYNAVYFSILTVLVGYLILEIWLCCALVRGSTERSYGHCKRWFWWRLGVVIATGLVAASDLYQMQVTYTLLIWVPLTMYRILTMFVVSSFMRQLKGEVKVVDGKVGSGGGVLP